MTDAINIMELQRVLHEIFLRSSSNVFDELKTNKDISYVLNTFCTISEPINKLSAEELTQPTKEQLRQLRLAYYTKVLEINTIAD